MSECCYGCGLCSAVCPTGAIQLKIKERGAIYYEIEKGCVNCGKCKVVCPANKDLAYPAKNIFYRAVTKHNEVLNKSSSGGLAFEISRRFILDGGVVYGATWDAQSQNVHHMRIDNVDDLTKIQGSLYVQSLLNENFYENILKDINNRPVLMTGCPCQIAAVRTWTHDHSNLLCIDLICHGVPSAEILAKQLAHMTREQIVYLSFRKGIQFVLDVRGKSRTYCEPWEDNPYFALFMHFASLRESCYSCKFANASRIGDITLGDYMENGKGYSCVVSNTAKSDEMIQKLQKDVEFEGRNIELLMTNHAFSRPTIKHPRTEKFTRLYEKYGLKRAYYLTFPDFIGKQVLKRIIGEKNYGTLRHLLRNR